MKDIDHFIGKDIYLLANDKESRLIKGFLLTLKLDSVLNKVVNIPVDETERICVVHGIFTSAKSIPTKVPNNTEIFVFIPKMDAYGNSCVIPVKSLELLERVVTAAIDPPPDLGEIEDEIVECLFDLDDQDIDDIYIIYGYRLQLTHYLIDKENKKDIIKGGVEIFNNIREAQYT